MKEAATHAGDVAEVASEIYPLAERHFQTIGKMLYHIAGISLHPGKEGLVRSRLAHRLRALKLDDFDSYLDFLERDKSGAELSNMVDVLTTNKTSFFRENEHFAFLQKDVLPALVSKGAPLRFWSAGCSTGEEPYTLGILLHELLERGDRGRAKILATDISSRVLAQAKAGRYAEAVAAEVPPELLRRHFTRGPGGTWEAGPSLRGLVTFARLNLMDAWPMRGPFQAIFCRNVMIYFDKPTQETLVGRYYDLLAPGGHLFVGHSESLSGIAHRFTYVQPAVYRK